MMKKMSGDIPFEIQEQIIKKVAPVKPLLRFRSVSKQWKALIDSSQFNTVNHTQPDHLLVSYKDKYNKEIYVSFADDDTFPRNKVTLTVPPIVELLKGPAPVVGCSHGLVGLVGGHPKPVNGKELFVLWNPSIRKSVGILVACGFSAMGFGVCRETGELKIIKCTKDGNAEVFTLSTRTSKMVSMNLSVPLRDNGCFLKHVVIHGVIYWMDHDNVTYIYRIVSFDLTREKFEEVYIPVNFKHENMCISKLKDSLVVFNEYVCDIWIMVKHDDSKCSFTKLYVPILMNYDLKRDRVVGLRKNGQLVTEHISKSYGRLFITLKVIEPGKRRFDDLVFDETSVSCFSIASYTESLLLLSYSDPIIMLW